MDRATVQESTVASISATASGVTRIASRMERAAATRSSPIGERNDGTIEARRERVAAEVSPISQADPYDSVLTRRIEICRACEESSRHLADDRVRATVSAIGAASAVAGVE